jgi:BioD-like phosphotransacetylase family protein
MHVKMSTWPVMSKIADFTPKLNIDDTHRVDEAVAWYEKHINFDELLRRTSSRDSSFDDPDSLPMRQ